MKSALHSFLRENALDPLQSYWDRGERTTSFTDCTPTYVASGIVRRFRRKRPI